MSHVQIPLAELQIGDQIAHIVRINNVSIRQGKKPWLAFTLGDKSGSKHFAKKWGEGSGATEEELKRYQSINVALVTGEVQTYNDKPSFVLKSIAQLAADDFPPEKLSEFLGEASVEKENTKGENMANGNEGSWSFKTKAEVNFDGLVKTQKPLRDCVENDPLNHVLRVCGLTASTIKNGTPVMDFQLGDAQSQPIKARLWRVPEIHLETLKEAKVLYVTGKVELYNGASQAKLDGDHVTIVSDATESDINQLVLSSPYQIKALLLGIWEIVQSFEDPHLKALCESLLKDPKNKNFRFVPAGLTYHHSWRSGLIEHTYRLLQLLDCFVKTYNSTPLQGNNIKLSRDTILTIGLYHDFFKHVEYTVDCGYAPEGNLLKHLSRGVMDIGARTSQIEGFPEKLRRILAHGVGAHHGKKEWGTIDTPSCPEAFIVHWFDNLCSKLDPTLTELNLLKGDNKFSTNRLKPLSSIPYLGGCKIGEVVPFSPVSLKEGYSKKDLEQCIRQLVENIQNEPIKMLCTKVLNSEFEKFSNMVDVSISPENKTSKYAFGLMEFTCRVMMFIGQFVNDYNERGWPGNKIYLDSDYLVGGALLQNYFKFNKGDPMLEDVGSCLMAIGEIAASIPDFPGDIRDLMAQIAASQAECSPELPICPESVTNHYYSHLLLYVDSLNLILSGSHTEFGRKLDGSTSVAVPMFGKPINMGNSSFINED